MQTQYLIYTKQDLKFNKVYVFWDYTRTTFQSEKWNSSVFTKKLEKEYDLLNKINLDYIELLPQNLKIKAQFGTQIIKY